MKLDSIRILNLRSLADTKTIRLRAVNVLVGVNSSGKSTFLRTFPLLRQSVETITTGPILWYGRYVDFGTLDQAVRKKSYPQEITFEFGLTLKENLHDRHYYYYGMRELPILETLPLSLSLCLGRSAKEGKTTARRIAIRLPSDEVAVEANDESSITSIRANGCEVADIARTLIFMPGENLLPQIVPKPDAVATTQQQQRRHPWQGPFEPLLRQAFLPLFSPQTGRSTKPLEIAHMVGLGSPEAQLARLKQMAYGGKVYLKKAADLTLSDPLFKQIRNAILLESLQQLVREIDSQLTTLFRPVRYVGPVRATAERYYRQQDLAVDEIDPQGANVAMFLQSLSWLEKSQFSEWCKEKIGFSVEARTDGSHISLLLRESGSNDEYNIADMGFGFSQILPVMAQIWSLSRETRPRQITPSIPRFYREDVESDRAGDIIAVEQPELHLHPRLQAKVADLFAAAAEASKAAKRPLTIVVETHSETIVNRIGHLVANGRLSPEDVQVLLFEKESAESDTTVSQAEFTREGVLTNWPLGFFLAASDDDRPIQRDFTTDHQM